MSPEQIRLLYEYNRWANRRALDACASLTEEQFTRDLRSSFRSVRDTLLHIMGGEWFWLERFRGRSPSAVPPLEPLPHPAAVCERWAMVERELLEFVTTRSAEDLARILDYRTTEGSPNAQPLWQMMQHLVNHGTYHRGQVTTMLRQLGAAAVATDLILYYREHNGETREAVMDPETLRSLYDYNAWANQRALEACAGLTGEQFRRDLGSSFRSVRDTLAHVLGAEWVWYERFQGRSPTALPPGMEFPDLASVRAHWAELERNLMSFVAGLTAPNLARVFEVRTLKGAIYANGLWQMLQHVVNHGTYHRGQVTTMLRQLGAKPGYTDLIYFFRERAGQALD
jgi:uncharacterized damage-inducible protein DinB